MDAEPDEARLYGNKGRIPTELATTQNNVSAT
jgi:hypothetical protein